MNAYPTMVRDLPSFVAGWVALHLPDREFRRMLADYHRESRLAEPVEQFIEQCVEHREDWRLCVQVVQSEGRN